MTKQELLSKIDQTYKHSNVSLNPLLSESTIKILHKLCCNMANAGTYRTTNTNSLGKGHMPPAPEDIEHYMHHFINQMMTSHIMFHPVEFAIIAYKRLLDIFPFETHNEETATMFMNLLLAQEGYPVLNSPARLESYESAMEKARMMPFPDTDPLILLIAEELIKNI